MRVLVLIAIQIALVTAAVTISYGANAQYAVQLTNMDNGKTAFWRLKRFPTKEACEAALGNVNSVLAAVSNPDPSADVPASTGVDPDLERSLLNLWKNILVNTGKVPHLSVACELPGDPA